MASYTRWSEGEPNNLFGVEDCVYWTSRGWLDADCYRNRQVDIYLQIVDRWNVAIFIKNDISGWKFKVGLRWNPSNLRAVRIQPMKSYQI